MTTPTGWTREGRALVAERRSPDFATAFALATRIALLAERRDHHPKITVGWGRLRVSLTTHDAGGITARDVEMAQEIAGWTDWND